MHRLVENVAAVGTRLSFHNLHQTAMGAEMPGHWHSWIIQINEYTLTSIINLKSSFTGWADHLPGHVAPIGFSTKGTNHGSIPTSQMGQSSPMVFSVPFAILKLAIPLTAFLRWAKYPLGSAITISMISRNQRVIEHRL
jgi:hypothetical protein